MLVCRFAVSREHTIRKASSQPKGREEAFAEMWEMAVVVHLLRVACFYQGPDAWLYRVLSLIHI